MIPMMASTAIHPAHSCAAVGNKGTQYRSIPYAPILDITAASRNVAVAGASE